MNFLVELNRENYLVVCEVVVAELAPYFETINDLLERLEDLEIEFDAINEGAAYDAGIIFKQYRREGGPRQRLIPDFLIAAHSQRQADALAATDLGYLRHYFPTLQLLQPETLG